MKKQQDQIDTLKEQLRDQYSEHNGSQKVRGLVKDVQLKNAEIEELRRKAKHRKDKIRMLKRENVTLKNAIREIDIKSNGGPITYH